MHVVADAGGRDALAGGYALLEVNGDGARQSAGEQAADAARGVFEFAEGERNRGPAIDNRSDNPSEGAMGLLSRHSITGGSVTEATIPIGVAAEEVLILPPQDSSAVRAQRFVRRVLAGAGVDGDLADVAVLTAKALVINGILHAHSALAVTIEVSPESIRIEVTDRDRQMLPGAASWGMTTISR